MNKPHECPWCSSCDAHIQKSSCALPVFFWVNCKTCGASSPYMKDYQDTVERWNDFSASTRANEKADDEGGEMAQKLKKALSDADFYYSSGKNQIFRLELELAASQREVEELKATIDPVKDWYDGDGRFTDVAQMLRLAISDLQADRALSLRLTKELAPAKRVIDVINHMDCDNDLPLEVVEALEDYDKALSPLEGEAKNEAAHMDVLANMAEAQAKETNVGGEDDSKTDAELWQEEHCIAQKAITEVVQLRARLNEAQDHGFEKDKYLKNYARKLEETDWQLEKAAARLEKAEKEAREAKVGADQMTQYARDLENNIHSLQFEINLLTAKLLTAESRLEKAEKVVQLVKDNTGDFCYIESCFDLQEAVKAYDKAKESK